MLPNISLSPIAGAPGAELTLWRKLPSVIVFRHTMIPGGEQYASGDKTKTFKRALNATNEAIPSTIVVPRVLL